ncbi:alpha/beta hydrolase family protein [Clostridium sp. Cult3]|uniref:alpha/beta hydrolase family protein n=1 Tax=Clostridium sp. Cult3 TaxID=2079004 RepID=UPI001F1BD2CC|nr:prolyl oligopeptidase family serine peptidase [Clostridium sp. Cult3]MCF6461216.1 hypothetical protein [Clostridium sp. Cult3]
MDYLKSNNILEEQISIGKIPAILFRPRESRELIPTIIFYHGWSSDKETQRMRGFILSSVGYQVVIPDAINHGERDPLYKYDMQDATKYFWNTIFTNIEESSIVIDDLVSKFNADPNRVGVIGNSMGGFTAAGVFTHNPSIKALVVFNGSCSWENSNKIFKQSFEIAVAEEQREIEEKIVNMDPMNNIELLINRPILLLHGDSDSVVSIESQRIFYGKIEPMYQEKEKIEFIQYPNLNHFVTTNMMEESIAWFHKYL